MPLLVTLCSLKGHCHILTGGSAAAGRELSVTPDVASGSQFFSLYVRD